MITCDQVVSGGSAERTTKMAAAPAADSVYSLPGFSTLHLSSPVSFSSSFPAFPSFSLIILVFYLSRFFFRSFNFPPGLSSLDLSHPYRVLRPVP